MNNSKTPILASAEGRTAGNALGQSYGLLNSRASIEFMKKVRESEFKLDIKPVAQIHDAMYFLIREDINVIKYVNDNLIKAMEWQDDPKIYHDKVKLGAELSIFYPDWSKELTIKNNATIEEIEQTIQDYVEKLE
jgi:DNA polymerase-1